MNLAKIWRQPLVTLNLGDHCLRAAELMKELRIRHLPVVDQEVPMGMVSDRDLLRAIGWWDNNPKHADTPITDWAKRLPVSEVMSTPLVCLPPDASLHEVARLMVNKKIGAVVIAGESRLRGILTETDCLQCGKGDAPWQRKKVSDHMTANIFRVSPDELIRSAWHLMRRKKIRHLVVMENEILQGILSDRDLLAAITWNAAGPNGIPNHVRHIMTTQVATIEPDASLAEAAERMLDWKIGALPVTDRDYLAGIITETDLLQILVRETD
jgi:CBS domain-containing protein